MRSARRTSHRWWRTWPAISAPSPARFSPCRAVPAPNSGAGTTCGPLRPTARGTSTPSPPTCRPERLVAHLGHVVGRLGVTRSDRLLVVLADAGARHLVEERPPLG